MSTDYSKDLTFDETHNWYNNLIKRTGWVMLSMHKGEGKDSFIKDMNDIIPKINNLYENTYDNDRKRDLLIMHDNMRNLRDIVNSYKNNGIKRRVGNRQKK